MSWLKTKCVRHLRHLFLEFTRPSFLRNSGVMVLSRVHLNLVLAASLFLHGMVVAVDDKPAKRSYLGGTTVVGESQTLDIHIPLPDPSAALAAATKVNSRLRDLDTNEYVDLGGVHTAHVTLYQTRFPTENVGQLKESLAQLALRLPACPGLLLDPEGAAVAGSYALWSVNRTQCLQLLSDAVVNATFSLAAKNQFVPSWVANLPEPERSVKIAMCKKYGNPCGVFLLKPEWFNFFPLCVFKLPQLLWFPLAVLPNLFLDLCRNSPQNLSRFWRGSSPSDPYPGSVILGFL